MVDRREDLLHQPRRPPARRRTSDGEGGEEAGASNHRSEWWQRHKAGGETEMISPKYEKGLVFYKGTKIRSYADGNMTLTDEGKELQGELDMLMAQ